MWVYGASNCGGFDMSSVRSSNRWHSPWSAVSQCPLSSSPFLMGQALRVTTGAGKVWRSRSDSSRALVHHWGPHPTRNALCLMRVRGQRVVCLEGAGSPRHTQSLTLALYLNQASGFRLPLSKAILLTSSRSLISFCAMLFVSLSLNRGRGQC